MVINCRKLRLCWLDEEHTSKFQNVVIANDRRLACVVCLLPNLMIIATSFLTRDDAPLWWRWSFTLDNYSRLLDPSALMCCCTHLNMALIATVACLGAGVSFAFPARLP